MNGYGNAYARSGYGAPLPSSYGPSSYGQGWVVSTAAGTLPSPALRANQLWSRRKRQKGAGFGLPHIAAATLLVVCMGLAYALMSSHHQVRTLVDQQRSLHEEVVHVHNEHHHCEVRQRGVCLAQQAAGVAAQTAAVGAAWHTTLLGRCC